MELMRHCTLQDRKRLARGPAVSCASSTLGLDVERARSPSTSMAEAEPEFQQPRKETKVEKAKASNVSRYSESW